MIGFAAKKAVGSAAHMHHVVGMRANAA